MPKKQSKEDKKKKKLPKGKRAEEGEKAKKFVSKKVKVKERNGGGVKSDRYFEAIGRRKTSFARLRLFTKGESQIVVNEKPYEKYFPTQELQQIVTLPLEKMNCTDKFRVSVKVKGGGVHSQAEAVRHALSRTLVLFNPNFKKRLKEAGFLTRDSRMRERKKFGLKRARKAPQWHKR